MSAKRVEANGITFNVVDEGDGDPVVLLHGFPDTSEMWRHQVPALRGAGYRVIAPDLRGYGSTDKPQAVEEYLMPTLIADVRGLLDALGIERAHIVGHDWGAALAWFFASFESERTRSVTALSVGHPSGFAWPSVEQRRRSWYMLFFQFQGVAEEALRKDDWRLLRDWTQDHPETDRYIAAFEEPGALTAALNWYRANVPPAGWFTDSLPYPKIEMPVLGVDAAGDHMVTGALMERSSEFVAGPWRHERFDCGHWIPLDEPDRLNALLLDFLRSA